MYWYYYLCHYIIVTRPCYIPWPVYIVLFGLSLLYKNVSIQLPLPLHHCYTNTSYSMACLYCSVWVKSIIQECIDTITSATTSMVLDHVLFHGLSTLFCLCYVYYSRMYRYNYLCHYIIGRRPRFIPWPVHIVLFVLCLLFKNVSIQLPLPLHHWYTTTLYSMACLHCPDCVVYIIQECIDTISSATTSLVQDHVIFNGLSTLSCLCYVYFTGMYRYNYLCHYIIGTGPRYIQWPVYIVLFVLCLFYRNVSIQLPLPLHHWYRTTLYSMACPHGSVSTKMDVTWQRIHTGASFTNID